MTKFIQEKVSLRQYTTFQIGGIARYFAVVRSIEEAREALQFAKQKGVETFILGGGSNVLISDEGFNGLVIKNAFEGIEIDGDESIIAAGAGVDWDEFVEYCVGRNLAGIECLSGIPGLVGGTPVQNVGAYGQEVSETIKNVLVLDRSDLAVSELSNADCGFSYRKSILNTTEKSRYLVLRVTYTLRLNGSPTLVYPDLQKRFEFGEPTLQEVRNAVLETRESKGMRVRQGGADARSAGSFFKNPIVNSTVVKNVVGKVEKDAPIYPLGKDSYKIPAAWLIEQAGFKKGFTKGKAGLSTKHTLAITNRDGASAEEIVALKNLIETGVKEKFGIQLETEPILVGF